MKTKAQGRPGPTTKLRRIWGTIEDREIADEWIKKGRAQWLKKLAKDLGVPNCETTPMGVDEVRWLTGFTVEPQRLGGGGRPIVGDPSSWEGGYSVPCRPLPSDQKITKQEFLDSHWPAASRELALKFTYLFVTFPDEAAALWSYARVRWVKLANHPQARARYMVRSMHFVAGMMHEAPPEAKEVAAAVEKRFGVKCPVHTVADAIEERASFHLGKMIGESPE
ncbi:MAG: hypothetical protein IPL39_18860 [Opitutaceae bacterium]|nr:hypothetical protein [Opitutaceae bacterium]